MSGTKGPLRELLGPLHPFKDDEEEQDVYLREDVEEDEDSVFVDAEELCSGGVKAGSLPGRLHVSIPDENTQEKCDVYGRFPITGAWWRVKVKVVKPGGSKIYQVQGFPSYFLQVDMSPPNQKNICSLFLKECGVDSETINKFLAWVNEVSSYDDLNFAKLRETLRTFYREAGKKNQKQSAQNGQEEALLNGERSLPLESTTTFIYVMTALRFPKIMEFLPVLLPRHFPRLIHSSSNAVLEEIEEILGTQPWKLGFSKITYRDLKLLCCEASWTAFSQCTPLLQLMTELEKNALVIYSQLKQVCREHGHTYVEEANFTSELLEHMPVFEAWRALKFLKDIGVVTYEKDCIFPYDLYQAERSIASSIGDLMSKSPWHIKVDVKKVLASICTTKPKDSISNGAQEESKADEAGFENMVGALDLQNSDGSVWDDGGDEVSVGTDDVELDQDQVAALEMICSNAVTVISGKGGCGKTTIVSNFFKHVKQLEEREVKKACEDFEQDQNVPEEWLTFTEENHSEVDKAIDVLLTAPTGKAAGLLRQKTALPAYTLCQVNYSFYLWNKNQGNTNSPWKFSSVRVLVVDEGSLVSVGIFKSVLKLLCEHSRLSKLIILGDIRQLPSIEPGNMLQDLFETLKSRQCAIELKRNHRAESQLIVDNATRISEHKFPEFDAELNISENPTLPISIQDKTFIFVRLPKETADSQSSQSDHQSYLYSAVRTLLQEKDFKSAKKSQFIAFRRQDCDLINDCCCKHYTGHLTRNAYLSELLPESTSGSQQNNDLEASVQGFCATPGDVTKNKRDFESGIRLCNGEIFFITNDVTDVTFGKRRYLTIDNMAGLEVTVDFGKLMQFCHIKHAWAKTIHTFQGSEEDTVVYVVGKAGRQHWKHVYTAITRGRCRVYVIAEESQLQRAICKRSPPRKTRLKHFLQNKLSTGRAPLADCPPESTSSGDSGGPSTLPSTSPLRRVPDNTATSNTCGSEASPATEETFAFGAGWQFPSLDDRDTDEDLAQSRGSKRSGGGGAPPIDESPSKFRLVCQKYITCTGIPGNEETKFRTLGLVEDSSPQVSSRLQNLRLNNLIPRQLFKPSENQET